MLNEVDEEMKQSGERKYETVIKLQGGITSKEGEKKSVLKDAIDNACIMIRKLRPSETFDNLASSLIPVPFAMLIDDEKKGNSDVQRDEILLNNE